jgi:UDP:flavonoid glycosyltransferase YjiC (YdhE family)
VPFGQDQPDNARRCVSLGVARTIRRRHYTPAVVAREIEQLMNDPVYEANAVEVRDLVRSERGTQTACDAIERVLQQPPTAEPAEGAEYSS